MAVERRNVTHREAKISPAGPIQSAGVRLLSVVLFFRAWMKPDVPIVVAPGQVRLEKDRLYAFDDAEATALPGTFLHTAWVRDWLGRRHSVKLELLAGVYDVQHASDADDVQPRHRQKVDLLLSAGSSVLPGRYVARRGFTAFQVRVQP